jgi:hypothetical protein
VRACLRACARALVVDCRQLIARTCAAIPRLPWCETALHAETSTISSQLVRLNRKGFLTINSQVPHELPRDAQSWRVLVLLLCVMQRCGAVDAAVDACCCVCCCVCWCPCPATREWCALGRPGVWLGRPRGLRLPEGVRGVLRVCAAPRGARAGRHANAQHHVLCGG